MKSLNLLITYFMIIGCSHASSIEQSKETVILLHGFGRSDFAVRTLAKKIRSSGFNVVSIEYSSLDQDIDSIRAEVYDKINNSLLEAPQERVHFVGHSLGGLLVRSYLDHNKVDKLSNVVIMGSPNKGTSVVDYLKDKWYFELVGPAAISLSANGSRFLSDLKRPYYNLGAIAGVKENPKHEYMLPGPDDGLVTVESAKVEGMSDFISMNISHTQMRYDSKVAAQVIHFLKVGKFSKRETASIKTPTN